jgi:Mg2+/Co2+ transporter CorB
MKKYVDILKAFVVIIYSEQYIIDASSITTVCYTRDYWSIFICREAIGKILARGHSRVPVYSGNPRNIIGLLLVSF